MWRKIMRNVRISLVFMGFFYYCYVWSKQRWKEFNMLAYAVYFIAYVLSCDGAVGNEHLINDDDLIAYLDHDGREDAVSYSNKWIVTADQESKLSHLAEANGFRYHGRVPINGVRNYHILEKCDRPEIHHEESFIHTDQLSNLENILWARQLHHKKLYKRDLIENGGNFIKKGYDKNKKETENEYRRKLALIQENLNKIRIVEGVDEHATEIQDLGNDIQSLYNQEFNDELWPLQWYELGYRINSTKPVIDMNLVPVYREYNITGNGVNVIIIDDGIEYTHDDLKNNYDERMSFNLNRNISDSLPRYEDPRNRHGTRCAGVVVMQANNKKCGVGIAYNAKVGGITLLDGITNELMEAQAITYANDIAHIYSGSWGPQDNGQALEGPGPVVVSGLLQGILKGRKGLGSLYVFAAGNGGMFSDHCGADGYVNTLYSIAVTSATLTGDVPYYAERCPAIMATTYSGTSHDTVKIVTTDLHNTCTMEHSGTSASAPLVAGILALVLEANANLTWRDVQHLLVVSSEIEQLKKNVDWSLNGIGLWFTPQFGFGLINAYKMVTLAKRWENVPEKFICRTPFNLRDAKRLTFDAHSSFVATVTSNTCGGKAQYLEHVQLVVNVSYAIRGHIQIELISPSGTVSKLLEPRKNDMSQKGFRNWPFMSVQFWGENPGGVWTVIVSDPIKKGKYRGRVEKLELHLHGTEKIPQHYMEKEDLGMEQMIRRLKAFKT